MKELSLCGKRFGRLRVICRAGASLSGNRKWTCACDCGRTATIVGSCLASGRTSSCGCLNREALSRASTKHGMTGSREYTAHAAMKRRCSNPNVSDYGRYGGRGIKVCERWEKFENFYEDMGPAPEGHSIDRIDVDGDYCPENCRWADDVTQGNNKRNNRRVIAGGESLTVAEWARKAGLPCSTVLSRLRRGWSPERAVGVA
jgi:hypothetical protein